MPAPGEIVSSTEYAMASQSTEIATHFSGNLAPAHRGIGFSLSPRAQLISPPSPRYITAFGWRSRDMISASCRGFRV